MRGEAQEVSVVGVDVRGFMCEVGDEPDKHALFQWLSGRARVQHWSLDLRRSDGCVITPARYRFGRLAGLWRALVCWTGWLAQCVSPIGFLNSFYFCSSLVLNMKPNWVQIIPIQIKKS